MTQLKKILTISIPTYNRKSQLLRLLHSIESQNCEELYQVNIIDNHSSYSVDDTIKTEFAPSFYQNIHIYKRPFNAGADYNISSVLLHVDTELMWLVGDDDETIQGSIRTIVENYKSNPEISFFKYPATPSIEIKENIVLNSVAELKECYNKGMFYPGDLIFMSNNVYNVEKVNKYFCDCLYYSYCSASQTLPFLFTLVTDNEKALFCKDIVVKYNEPEGDHWNYSKIVTSLGSFLDINRGDKYSDIADFFYIMCDHFGMGQFLLECLEIKDRQYRRYIYKKALLTVFAHKKSLQDYFARFMYLCEHYSKIPFMSKGYAAIYKKQNGIKERLKEKALYDEKTRRLVVWLKKYMPKLK